VVSGRLGRFQRDGVRCYTGREAARQDQSRDGANLGFGGSTLTGLYIVRLDVALYAVYTGVQGALKARNRKMGGRANRDGEFIRHNDRLIRKCA